jgi:hypothetical protein
MAPLRHLATAAVLGALACHEPPTPPIVATTLAFTVQPASTAAGTTITPAVAVVVQDAAGNTVTTATNSITVAIGSNAGGGTLSGTTTVAAVNGVATFSNLRIDNVGAGYTLSAASPNLTSATSIPFAVVTGPAAKLAFTDQPAVTTAGATITPAVTVAVQDVAGNTIISAKR